MKTSTIRLIQDPENGDQLASLVVIGFGTLNFPWADPNSPLLGDLGGGYRVTVTRMNDTTFRCVIKIYQSVLHDLELQLIGAPD